MKQLLLGLTILLLTCIRSSAQGENNIWTFGMDANPSINFNLPTPGITMLPNSANLTHWASAVCKPNGQLRFYVRLKFNFSGAPEYYIFDPLGSPIAGSDLDTDAGMLDFSMPVVIPRPGNPDQYYIFYSKDDGLLYSLLDMSLNGGQGAVSAAEKDVPLTGPASVYTRLITAVKGCNATWLVIRSQNSNEYFSWAVRPSGVDTHRVVSQVGNFQLEAYPFGGFLKASHQGNHLATTNWAGVEIYDFEQCSGRVKNARVLDTTGNPDYFPGAAAILPSHTRFTGVGFSPNDSKLYVTKNGFENYQLIPGSLFQFDMSLPTVAAIIASGTLVFQNLPYLGADITGQCNQVTPNPLGEVKAGPDGRVYIDNGSVNCRDTANVPPGFNPAPGFHVLDAPDNPAATCLPDFNRIVYANGAEFYGSGYPNSFLQNDIIIASPPQRLSSVIPVTVCFNDSIYLAADTAARCLQWDNGQDSARRLIRHPGVYYLSYYKSCVYHTDTFKVQFIKPPVLSVIAQSCENSPSGAIAVKMDSAGGINWRIIWKHLQSGNIIADHTARDVDTLRGLLAGQYAVYISGLSGCDTVLKGQVFSFAAPALWVSADTVIRYGDSVRLMASGASLYTWTPASPLDTPIGPAPMARLYQPTSFSVIAIDQNGCRDTGYIRVDIDFRMKDFLPNAFSPNGDGLNDVFKIEGITYQKIRLFKVFNRFGQVVFFTADAVKGWDGTQNGQPCQPGVYHYLIEVVYPDNRSKLFKGDVTLIR